jgi:DNA polymerase-3 subunit gamma/tau
MLSKDAWGALLKTLEEPPKHVIFILATTELHKVPETIISRCQVFNFKKASEVSLKKMLADVAKKEDFELEKGVAELLAILADGSFRDGLGVLQKVLNFANTKTKKVTLEEVEKITGTPKTVLVNDYIKAIATEDVEKGISTVEKANEENLDMKLFLKLIIIKFRMAVVLRYAPKLEKEMRGDLSDEDLEFLKSLIKVDEKGMLRSRALGILLDAYANIENAFVGALPIELALIKIISKEE